MISSFGINKNNEGIPIPPVKKTKRRFDTYDTVITRFMICITINECCLYLMYTSTASVSIAVIHRNKYCCPGGMIIYTVLLYGTKYFTKISIISSQLVASGATVVLPRSGRGWGSGQSEKGILVFLSSLLEATTSQTPPLIFGETGCWPAASALRRGSRQACRWCPPGGRQWRGDLRSETTVSKGETEVGGDPEKKK